MRDGNLFVERRIGPEDEGVGLAGEPRNDDGPSQKLVLPHRDGTRLQVSGRAAACRLALEIGIHQIMTTRTLLKRLEKAEEALKAQLIFSQDCICFPDKEQPFFCSPSEEPVAARVKCP